MSDLPPPPSSPLPSVPPPPPSLVPPGYTAYGAPPDRPYGVAFQSVGGVAKALNVLLIIYLPLQLLTVVSTYRLSSDAKDFLSGDMSERTFRDNTSTNFSGLSGLLVIPIAVLTMITMFRMARNLRVLRSEGQTWKPGWAIGGWFCPPFVFVIPWLMFRELWKGSDPSATYDWKRGKVSPLINIWWVLYGLVPLIGFGTAAGLFANFSRPSIRDLAEKLDDFALVNLILQIVSLGTTVVYLLMIRQLVARHRAATGTN